MTGMPQADILLSATIPQLREGQLSRANATDHVYVDNFEAQLQAFIIKLRRQLYPN